MNDFEPTLFQKIIIYIKIYWKLCPRIRIVKTKLTKNILLKCELIKLKRKRNMK